MAVTINADTSNGLVLTPDTSGDIKLQSAGTDIATVTSSGITMASGKTLPAASLTGALPAIDGSSLTNLPQPAALTTASGSAPSYSARAWVNFNGTGTVAIRASGNVSSITDINVGRYQMNFTTAMPDADYTPIFAQSSDGSAYWSSVATPYTNGGYGIITPTTSNFVFGIQRYNYSSWLDVPYVLVAVFR